MRHSWPDHLTTRYPNKTERECANGCGIVKVTRHEGVEHWTEFWRDGDKIKGQGTPACERVRVDA